jgi:hypothetical protein
VGAAVAKKQKKLRLRSYAPTVAVTRKLTATMVDARRQQFEAGEDWALLDAVDFCARGGMAMPLWLANAFCERYASWSLFETRTLDAAFRVERKGARLPDRARREWLKPRVVLRVLLLHGQRVPIDEGLFEKVGTDLGIPAGTARDIYYEAKARREFLTSAKTSG